MTEDSLLPFDLPAVQRKKVTADFEGGLISSDGGLLLLREADRRLGLAGTLAGCIRECRDPARAIHTLPAMLRFRMFVIACGYEVADDCDELRADLLFKLAVGRTPESGRDLCSQPTMSRLENAPSSIEVARMTVALVDIFCRFFSIPPAAITLDIDDTCDRVHGHQQSSLFLSHYDRRLASVGLGRGSPVQRRMWPLGIVKGDPIGYQAPGREAVGDLVQIDRFVFERAPQPLDEDIVHAPAASVYRGADAGLGPLRPGAAATNGDNLDA